MTDLHAHVLWGLDDGSASEGETLALLRLEVEQGVRQVAATPHATPGFRPFDWDDYSAKLERANALCAAEGLELTILAGAEIAATYQTPFALRNRLVPALGGSDYALIELWRDIPWHTVYQTVDDVIRAGYLPILAHVERYNCFLWEPKRALAFRRETGALLQMNASSLMMRQGILLRRFQKRLFQEEGIDVIASDAHNLRDRAPNLMAAQRVLAEQVGPDYAQRLTNFQEFKV